MALSRYNYSWLFVVIIVVLAIMALPLLPDPIPANGHVMKRGLANYEKTSMCQEDRNAKLFHNPKTGRWGKVCIIEDEWFVVILDGANKIITGFPKEKMNSFIQVVQYMKNAGYTLIQ